MARNEQPQEIVLTWSSEPREVVLTYERELPVRRAAEPAAQVTLPAAPVVVSAEPEKKKKRRWPWILGGVAAAALLIGLGIAAAYSVQILWDQIAGGSGGRREEGGMNPYEDDYGYHWEIVEEYETTLPTYPLGGEFRLEFTEEHGPALSAQAIYEKVNPSVVAVVTYSETSGGTGTGIIMSEDGYVLTNHHVIAGGNECYILLSDGSYYPAALVAGDAEQDLAVLKAEAEGLPAAEFGASDNLVVGDTVYAIGNPLGLELRGTLTDGIVSAINRDVDVSGITMTLIQTNAALNSGNSGGPLINIYGQVVGINTIKMVSNYDDDSFEGLGFAIPVSSGVYAINSLIQHGEVRPEPVLGIMVMQQLTMLEDGLGGLEVTEVTPGLGGELGGMQAGDYIIRADGEPVSTTTDIYRARRRYTEGENLPMTVWRDGEEVELQIPLMVEEAAETEETDE